ncbi:unnamed protein product [Closterium sp. NIES-65]|nr:unnamed protein product [Closterium sp. NIES-65]
MQSYSVVLGRNSKKSSVDLDLSALGGGMNVSRNHARIFYDFAAREFRLEVLGKNGVYVDGQSKSSGSDPIPLKSQQLLQVGDKRFYFLLPARKPDPHAKPEPPPAAGSAPGPLVHALGNHSAKCQMAVGEGLEKAEKRLGRVREGQKAVGERVEGGEEQVGRVREDAVVVEGVGGAGIRVTPFRLLATSPVMQRDASPVVQSEAGQREQREQGSRLVGAQGMLGLQGARGEGAHEMQGVQGLQGLQDARFVGAQGENGAQQGMQGTQGTQGIQGIQGIQGLQSARAEGMGVVVAEDGRATGGRGRGGRRSAQGGMGRGRRGGRRGGVVEGTSGGVGGSEPANTASGVGSAVGSAVILGGRVGSGMVMGGRVGSGVGGGMDGGISSGVGGVMGGGVGSDSGVMRMDGKGQGERREGDQEQSGKKRKGVECGGGSGVTGVMGSTGGVMATGGAVMSEGVSGAGQVKRMCGPGEG